MNKEMSQCFRDAFLKNYSELVKETKPVKIMGVEDNLKESPIGLGD
jgi:hypothetical protein